MLTTHPFYFEELLLEELVVLLKFASPLPAVDAADAPATMPEYSDSVFSLLDNTVFTYKRVSVKGMALISLKL